jgi:hypothetical protein
MIENFQIPNYENGQTILADELDAIFSDIHSVIGALIQDNQRTILLPAGFAGSNTIETPDVTNSLISVGADNNANIVKLNYLQSLVNSAVEAMNSANSSAASAAQSLVECQLILAQTQQLRDEVELMRQQVITVTGGGDAYDVAVGQGFAGTRAQWLASLVGKSAYQVALDNGFVGTQSEWLSSLQGIDGDLTEALLPTTGAYKQLESLAIAGL